MGTFTASKASGDEVPASWLAAVVAELRPLYVKKSADQSIVSPGSTTLQADTALLLPVAANTLYDLSLRLILNTNNTANFKLQFTAPAGSTSSVHLFTGSAATAASVLQGPFDAIASSLAVGSPGGADFVALVQGWLLTAGTPGNVTLTWAQNVLNASTTTVRAGSTFRLDQVQ